MKRISTVVIITLLVCSTAVMAETSGKKGDFGLYAGWFHGDDVVDVQGAFDPEISSTGEFGVGVGFYLTEHFGLDLTTRYIQSKIEIGRYSPVSPSIDMLVFDIDGIVHFNKDAKSVFFMVFGPSYVLADQDSFYNDKDSFGGNLGIGVKTQLNDRLNIRFDVKYRYFDQLVDIGDAESDLVQPDSSNTFSTTLGLVWMF